MSDKLTPAEIQELQDKKEQIREELYDQVKEEMFEANIDFDYTITEKAVAFSN